MYFFQTIISVECYLFLVYVNAERERKKRERIQVYEDLVEDVYFFFEKNEEE